MLWKKFHAKTPTLSPSNLQPKKEDLFFTHPLYDDPRVLQEFCFNVEKGQEKTFDLDSHRTS